MSTATGKKDNRTYDNQWYTYVIMCFMYSTQWTFSLVKCWPESSKGLKFGPINHQKQTWGLKFDTLRGSRYIYNYIHTQSHTWSWNLYVPSPGELRQTHPFFEARIPDRLRAACAADAAEKAEKALAPVAQQVLKACEKALPGAEEPLPVSWAAMSREWPEICSISCATFVDLEVG